MRLFVAIDLGEAVRREAAGASRELRRRFEGTPARLTWVPPERMHLTVRFIGEVRDSEVPRLAATLAPPLPLLPFDLSWDGVDALPTAGRPRVIVVRALAGGEALHRLEQAVSDRLVQAGVPPEMRPYRPHLTLARVKDGGGVPFFEVLAGFEKRIFGSDRVEAITLFRSAVSSRGPVYEALQRTTMDIPERDSRDSR